MQRSLHLLVALLATAMFLGTACGSSCHEGECHPTPADAGVTADAAADR